MYGQGSSIVTGVRGAPSAEQRVVSLKTGQLVVRVDRCDLALDEICGFASRQNPKRGFLFVSKVLGKHVPARPSVMRDVYRCLASKISGDLPGPVVVIGMAETAIALGHGVYDELVRLTGRSDLLFIHSTRYQLQREKALEFLEEHSHAADHIVYMPESGLGRELFLTARSLVLVDDEASTGNTFVNLAKSFKATIPSLNNVVTVVITDWRGAQRQEATRRAMPVPSLSVSILEGEYQFVAAPNLQALQMPKVVGNGQVKDGLLICNYGRLGLQQVLGPDLNRLESLDMAFCQRCLILGTGEFAYPAFLLTEELEKRGHDVHFQSTTRSPILLGGAIQHALAFRDNYADDIANFVYNVAPSDYDRIIVCHETPSVTLDAKLLTALGAENLEF